MSVDSSSRRQTAGVGPLFLRHEPSRPIRELYANVAATDVILVTTEPVELPVLETLSIFRIPEEKVAISSQIVPDEVRRRPKDDERHEVLGAKDFVDHAPDEMHVLLPDLDKDRSR